ncbi:hypothetical protein BGZ70_003659 [Mortierella alpina]|uniref:tRNA nucleotidyltransferase n=1 Tax=Mortierella alpina TaxID=64518 RepID=A0A9P6JAK1_MORAP|nr:hypothetical protein BGZ70_003659 [Mortierella alpina]
MKRRSSSPDLFSTQDEEALHRRIVPVNYGTSVFFRRPLSTTAASDQATRKEDQAILESVPQMEPRSMVICLTKQEAKICQVLDDVAQKYEAREGKKVQLRIAGGWVRDKLLGLSSHDIDIGLDTMMGYEFAELVNKYLELRGHRRRTIAKIATNPEKSKHLETATMMVMGTSIDFVNLRSELYDDDSRIPSEIAFGSPTEDAYRRDITINALFYNIHTHSVEDFTGKGLEDLKNGLIRTPLAAFETFCQDPLRVLRCIRFAARFQFTLAEDIRVAILDLRIRQALKTKISKERIGAELEKMIDYGAGRSTALGLLQELGLYDVVFAKPEVSDVAKGTTAVEGEVQPFEDAFKLVWIMEWLLRINPAPAGIDEEMSAYTEQDSLLNRVHNLLSATSHLCTVIRTRPLAGVAMIPQTGEPFPEKLATRTLILAAMIYPYREMMTTVNKKQIPAGSWILRYGLKGRNIDIDIVTKLMSSIKTVQEVVDRVSREDGENAALQSGASDEEARLQHQKKERAEMGMLIRDIGFITVIGKKWPCALLLGLAVELIPQFELLQQGILHEDAGALLAKYNSFLSKAQMYQIDHCFAWKYLVDGKELVQLLGRKPSHKVTGYLQTEMQWMLQNPQTSKEDCQRWIVEHPDLFP